MYFCNNSSQDVGGVAHWHPDRLLGEWRLGTQVADRGSSEAGRRWQSQQQPISCTNHLSLCDAHTIDA